jgi:hypothetical protein
MSKPLAGASLILMSIFLSTAVEAESIVFQSGETQISLIELYSSEGCSSCPPAEKWLTNLKESPGLWKAFVPVCFHVDYWDYLGWKDDLGSPQFTKRQRTSAQYLKLDSVYTPGFLVNGREWRGWFDGKKSFPLTSEKIGQLKVTMQKPLEFQIQFQPLSNPPYKYRIEVALMGMAMTSRVTAGENKGKTLQHDFAVLGHKTRELAGEGRDLEATLILPPPRMKAQEYSVAIWVTKHDNPMPLQAVGGVVPVKFVR